MKNATISTTITKDTLGDIHSENFVASFTQRSNKSARKYTISTKPAYIELVNVYKGYFLAEKPMLDGVYGKHLDEFFELVKYCMADLS